MLLIFFQGTFYYFITIFTFLKVLQNSSIQASTYIDRELKACKLNHIYSDTIVSHINYREKTHYFIFFAIKLSTLNPSFFRCRKFYALRRSYTNAEQRPRLCSRFPLGYPSLVIILVQSPELDDAVQ